jgi:hypothetical protein
MSALFSVEFDVNHYAGAGCVSKACDALPYDLGDRVISGERLAADWPVLPHLLTCHELPAADIMAYCPGAGMVISQRVLDLPGARRGFERCAEILPILLEGQGAWFLHVQLLEVSLLDTKKTIYRPYGAAIVKDPVLKKGVKLDGWLYRIGPYFYVPGEGRGGFVEFYRQHDLTGLEFKKVKAEKIRYL